MTVGLCSSASCALPLHIRLILVLLARVRQLHIRHRDGYNVVYPSAPAPVFAAHAIVDLRVDCDEPRPRTQYEAPTQATHTLWHTGGGRAQEICRQSCYLCRAVHRHSRSVHRECLFMRMCHPSRYRTGRVAACWTAACHALAFAMLAVTRCREATCNMAACSRTCSWA